MVLNLDIESGFFVAMTLYYAAMRLMSLKKASYPPPDLSRFGCVLIVPCHNEERVITSTLENLTTLAAQPHIVVVDDGSTDRTGELADAFASDRVHVYRRVAPNAAQGKGEALNAAYAWVAAQLADWFPGINDAQIVIGVVDADVTMTNAVLEQALSVLDHTDAGAVQAPVSIQGAEDNILLMMQDIEFMTFSYLMQQARHWIGSVGMGGNGQFARYSAMKLLGSRPWSRALTEDADLGMQFIAHNIRLAFTGGDPVVQHGLTSYRRLIKQRTRWAQGHYQIWKRMPEVWRSRRPLITKLDSTIYMLLITAPMVLVVSYLIDIAAGFNLVQVTNPWLQSLAAFGSWVPPVVQITVSFAIQIMLLSSYPRVSGKKIAFWEWPAIHILFALYSEVIWIPASLNALWRMLTRRSNWVKTERETVSVSLPS